MSADAPLVCPNCGSRLDPDGIYLFCSSECGYVYGNDEICC